MSFERWTNTTLGEVIELKRGYDLPSQKRIEGNIPIVSSSGISGNHNECKVKGPGVVTGRYGTIGKVFYIDEPFWPLNTTLYVRDFKGNNPLFISYFLSTLNFYAYIDKAAVPGVNRNHIHMARVSVPAISEQKRIASILKSLDNKIELNNAINKNLEEMAQALFKRWFVEFEFPNENGEPYKSSGGELEESELGLIPKGWRVELLPEYLDFLEGPGIRNWQYKEEGIRFLNIRCIKNQDIDISTTNKVSKEEAYGKYKHFLLEENDVVVSTSGTLGRSAVIRKEHLPLMLNTSIIRFRPKYGMRFAYMYQYLNSQEFYQELITKASGSVQLNFGPMHLKRIKMLIPPNEILNHFESAISKILLKLNQSRTESKKLVSIRDTLLPKLMSGEIRVPLDQA